MIKHPKLESGRVAGSCAFLGNEWPVSESVFITGKIVWLYFVAPFGTFGVDMWSCSLDVTRVYPLHHRVLHNISLNPQFSTEP